MVLFCCFRPFHKKGALSFFLFLGIFISFVFFLAGDFLGLFECYPWPSLPWCFCFLLGVFLAGDFLGLFECFLLIPQCLKGSLRKVRKILAVFEVFLSTVEKTKEKKDSPTGFCLFLGRPKPEARGEEIWRFQPQEPRHGAINWEEFRGEILVGRSAQRMKHENAQKFSYKISPNSSPRISPGHKNLSPQFRSRECQA